MLKKIVTRLQEQSPPLLVSGEESTEWNALVPQIISRFWGQEQAQGVFDTVHINQERTRISVADVKEMRSGLRHAPATGRRLVVIEASEHLGHEAAGGLLKTLEEPMAGTNFLLTTSHLRQILPTIRSRCEVIRLPAEPHRKTKQEVDLTAIEEVLAQKGGSNLSEDDLAQLGVFIQNKLSAPNPNVYRCLLRLRDYYKIRSAGGNVNLAADVLRESARLLAS